MSDDAHDDPRRWKMALAQLFSGREVKYFTYTRRERERVAVHREIDDITTPLTERNAKIVPPMPSTKFSGIIFFFHFFPWALGALFLSGRCAFGFDLDGGSGVPAKNISYVSTEELNLLILDDCPRTFFF
jgi:hypothetical protein